MIVIISGIVIIVIIVISSNSKSSSSKTNTNTNTNTNINTNTNTNTNTNSTNSSHNNATEAPGQTNRPARPPSPPGHSRRFRGQARRPHPQKSALLNVICLDCSEFGRFECF